MNLYMFVDKFKYPLYIGKTKNATSTRIAQHFSTGGHLPKELFEEYEDIIHMKCKNEYELTVKEIIYIGKYKPKFNKQYVIDDTLTKSLASIIKNDHWIRFANREDLLIKTQVKINLYRDKIREERIEELKTTKIIDRIMANNKLSIPV